MPQKNRRKIYVAGGFYHVYNRGVAKNKIFKRKTDYLKFLGYVSDALLEPQIKKVEFILRGRAFKAEPRSVKNFKDEIDIIAYCLMPNHFHFLLRQNGEHSMKDFMQSLNTRYVSYFNKIYKRVGPLYQDRYKAVLVKNDEYLLHLSRYIHLNPKELGIDLKKSFSSYSVYLGINDAKWVKPKVVLDFFSKKVKSVCKKTNTYQKFVEGKLNENKSEGSLPERLKID